jgi:hypothetical protein
MRIVMTLSVVMATVAPAAAQAPALPKDVAAFVHDRQGCDHFRGEYSDDRERARFIRQNVIRLCKGADRRLAALKKKHKANASVMAVLDAYEDRIE